MKQRKCKRCKHEKPAEAFPSPRSQLCTACHDEKDEAALDVKRRQAWARGKDNPMFVSRLARGFDMMSDDFED